MFSILSVKCFNYNVNIIIMLLRREIRVFIARGGMGTKTIIEL